VGIARKNFVNKLELNIVPPSTTAQILTEPISGEIILKEKPLNLENGQIYEAKVVDGTTQGEKRQSNKTGVVINGKFYPANLPENLKADSTIKVKYSIQESLASSAEFKLLILAGKLDSNKDIGSAVAEKIKQEDAIKSLLAGLGINKNVIGLLKNALQNQSTNLSQTTILEDLAELKNQILDESDLQDYQTIYVKIKDSLNKIGQQDLTPIKEISLKEFQKLSKNEFESLSKIIKLLDEFEVKLSSDTNPSLETQGESNVDQSKNIQAQLVNSTQSNIIDKLKADLFKINKTLPAILKQFENIREQLKENKLLQSLNLEQQELLQYLTKSIDKIIPEKIVTVLSQIKHATPAQLLENKIISLLSASSVLSEVDDNVSQNLRKIFVDTRNSLEVIKNQIFPAAEKQKLEEFHVYQALKVKLEDVYPELKLVQKFDNLQPSLASQRLFSAVKTIYLDSNLSLQELNSELSSEQHVSNNHVNELSAKNDPTYVNTYKIFSSFNKENLTVLNELIEKFENISKALSKPEITVDDKLIGYLKNYSENSQIDLQQIAKRLNSIENTPAIVSLKNLLRGVLDHPKDVLVLNPELRKVLENLNLRLLEMQDSSSTNAIESPSFELIRLLKETKAEILQKFVATESSTKAGEPKEIAVAKINLNEGEKKLLRDISLEIDRVLNEQSFSESQDKYVKLEELLAKIKLSESDNVFGSSFSDKDALVLKGSLAKVQEYLSELQKNPKIEGQLLNELKKLDQLFKLKFPDLTCTFNFGLPDVADLNTKLAKNSQHPLNLATSLSNDQQLLTNQDLLEVIVKLTAEVISEKEQEYLGKMLFRLKDINQVSSAVNKIVKVTEMNSNFIKLIEGLEDITKELNLILGLKDSMDVFETKVNLNGLKQNVIREVEELLEFKLPGLISENFPDKDALLASGEIAKKIDIFVQKILSQDNLAINNKELPINVRSLLATYFERFSDFQELTKNLSFILDGTIENVSDKSTNSIAVELLRLLKGRLANEGLAKWLEFENGETDLHRTELLGKLISDLEASFTREDKNLTGTIKQAQAILKKQFNKAIADNKLDFANSEINKAVQSFDNLVKSQEILQRINPLVQAAGEPTFLMFPMLIGGFLSKLEASFYPAENVYDQEKNQSGGEGGKSLSKFSFKIELPNLGNIEVFYSVIQFIHIFNYSIFQIIHLFTDSCIHPLGW